MSVFRDSCSSSHAIFCHVLTFSFFMCGCAVAGYYPRDCVVSNFNDVMRIIENSHNLETLFVKCVVPAFCLLFELCDIVPFTPFYFCSRVCVRRLFHDECAGANVLHS